MIHSLASNVALAEGGAAGHLKHFHEDLSTTLGEIQELMRAVASSARGFSVSEKLDGMNLVFTMTPAGAVRLARNGSDVKSGGFDGEELQRRFGGRGQIGASFAAAYEVLQRASRSMSRDERSSIFADGARWLSAEVVDPANANVVKYSRAAVVVHETPVFLVRDGAVTRVEAGDAVERLRQLAGAALKGPSPARGTVSRDTLSAGTASIAKIQRSLGLTKSSTVADVVRAALERSGEWGDSTADVAACAAGDFGVAELKARMRARGDEPLAAADVAAARERGAASLDAAVRSFALDALSQLQSSMVDDHSAAVADLRDRLASAIDRIEARGDDSARSALEREMLKLPRDLASSSVEGVVVRSGAKAWKLTGAFAPIQKILGLARALPESRTRVLEGGRAFGAGAAQRVTKREVLALWSELQDALESAGASEFELVGSAGKRETSGDIDVAVGDSDAAAVTAAVKRAWPGASVRAVGGRVVSALLPVPDSDKLAQVDFMLADVKLARWTRWSPSDDRSASDYSEFKGIVRNLLLNALALAVSERTLDGGRRSRLTVDWDSGLRRVEQRRSGARWVTTAAEHVTADPDDVARELLGHGFSARDLQTAESLSAAIARSKIARPVIASIERTFERSLRDVASTSPASLGDDPAAVIDRALTILRW